MLTVYDKGHSLTTIREEYLLYSGLLDCVVTDFIFYLKGRNNKKVEKLIYGKGNYLRQNTTLVLIKTICNFYIFYQYEPVLFWNIFLVFKENGKHSSAHNSVRFRMNIIGLETFRARTTCSTENRLKKFGSDVVDV